ncbi:hypothetical protein NDU88_011813 [Pleurodeles waltl]|uniref:Uncharacterized protein n=1 Tax=Pleurodeles waltl TaxID=8319 RepID=A0AAV7S4U0_PLEWA|nr:hypothetical protein NDU88_011813 [Pleurodeles waltl]
MARGAWPGHETRRPLRVSAPSRGDPGGGGDGGAKTAGQLIVSGALLIRNSGDADLCPGTPQERDGRQETRGSPKPDKAWQEGQSRVFGRPGTARLHRKGGC